MTEECQECGKEFDTERGLNIHKAQKHKEEGEEKETSSSEEAGVMNNIVLTPEKFGGLTFLTGLFLGMLLGGVFLGGMGSGQADVGLPGGEQDGNPDGGVVELASAEYPYGDLEAGTGAGQRHYDNITFNLTGEPYIGSPDAEVKMVSYEDFECPFCSEYNQNAYPQIVENFVQPGQVQYFYSNLPLRIHPWAEPSAIASECALNQDAEAFWTFKKGFFDNQEALGNAYNSGNFDESMYRWAEQTGLNVEQFRTCYDNEEELSEVNQDKREASDNGAQATPSIFVNGELVQGAQPYTRFETAINDALQ
jgi:protein-disulfide isomerase